MRCAPGPTAMFSELIEVEGVRAETCKVELRAYALDRIS